MLIIGCKGFAKEIATELYFKGVNDFTFFDNTSINKGNVFGNNRVLSSIDEVIKEKNISSFVLGLGNPNHREKMYNLFSPLLNPFTLISERSRVGPYDNIIENGVTIMAGTIITASVKIGKGCLINLNCTIGHDSLLSDFVELCPGVHVSGNCIIGSNTFVGTGAVILPNIRIGKNVVIAAGSTVTKDICDNVLVAGTPAVVKRVLANE